MVHALILFLSLCSSAHAFHIGEHGALSQQAVRELRSCAPDFISTENEEIFVSADIDEDTSVFRKWFRFSHYFHPLKTVEMVRFNSMDRVTGLEENLSSMQDLGYIAHHIQDASVPAHVVPIGHWLGDRFEWYDSGFPSDDPDCSFLQTQISKPRDILVQVALQTLQSLSEKFPAVLSREPTQLDWSFFWNESGDSSFGHYSHWIGDDFGSTEIQTNDGIYQVSDEIYRKYKQKQMRNAVNGTKLLLLWAHGRLGFK